MVRSIKINFLNMREGERREPSPRESGVSKYEIAEMASAYAGRILRTNDDGNVDWSGYKKIERLSKATEADRDSRDRADEDFPGWTANDFSRLLKQIDDNLARSEENIRSYQEEMRSVVDTDDADEDDHTDEASLEDQDSDVEDDEVSSKPSTSSALDALNDSSLIAALKDREAP